MNANEIQDMIDRSLVELCHRINELHTDDESDFSLTECIDIAGREVARRIERKRVTRELGGC